MVTIELMLSQKRPFKKVRNAPSSTDWCVRLPNRARRSITFDRGTEFTGQPYRHGEGSDLVLRSAVPWQTGTVDTPKPRNGSPQPPLPHRPKADGHLRKTERPRESALDIERQPTFSGISSSLKRGQADSAPLANCASARTHICSGTANRWCDNPDHARLFFEGILDLVLQHTGKAEAVSRFDYHRLIVDP